MSVVYYSKEIVDDKLINLFKFFKPRITSNDICAIKVTFGEEGNKGHVKPHFIKIIVDEIKQITQKIFVTDTNTIYRGRRYDTISHLVLSEEHGFNYENCGCPVIIADGILGGGGMEVEVNLKWYKKVKIANAIFYSDVIIFITHFTGHLIFGFGGTLKNVAMGCATKEGKYSMHHSVFPKHNYLKCQLCTKCIKCCPVDAISIVEGRVIIDGGKCVGCAECVFVCPYESFKLNWDEKFENAHEKLIEYAFGVVKNKRCYFINFLNFITKNCDCFKTNAPALVDDVGIVASDDPVAVDRASIDLINEKYGKDLFKEIYPGINYERQFEYAKEIGFGDINYRLFEV